ncbi:MAG: hypothetical protein NT157_01660 [Candidatus Micrarchaeota archaeon]|nr:hypothetical protein [Candidatus Micrarchaeota archaeon]
MPQENPLLAEKGEIDSLVRERRQLEEKLSAARGPGSEFLLEACEGLTDLIDDFGEISSKKGEMEYAAIDTRVKFSRKVRHKTRDVGRFEQKLVRELDNKRITLKHVQKMAGIIKLLKSNKVDKAREEAGEFCQLLVMRDRLVWISDEVSRKRARIERAKRGISAQLSGLEWIEREPEPDLEKTGGHEGRLRLRESLLMMRLEYMRSLETMPLGELLGKMRDEELGKLGFPALSEEDMEGLSSFLHKSGLEGKSSEQLLELAELNPQKLRHLDVDSACFKREVVARKTFLGQIMALHSTGFLALDSKDAPALAYLSEHAEGAREAIAQLVELDKTAGEDELEWERMKQIERKKAELAGVEKTALIGSLRELERLEKILDGKEEAVRPEEETKTEKGPLGSILDFLKSVAGKK